MNTHLLNILLGVGGPLLLIALLVWAAVQHTRPAPTPHPVSLQPAVEPPTAVAPPTVDVEVPHVGATLAGLNVPTQVSADQARTDEAYALDRAYADILAALRPDPAEHERFNAIEARLADELAVLLGCALQWLEIDPAAELDVLGLGHTGEYTTVELEGASR